MYQTLAYKIPSLEMSELQAALAEITFAVPSVQVCNWMRNKIKILEVTVMSLQAVFSSSPLNKHSSYGLANETLSRSKISPLKPDGENEVRWFGELYFIHLVPDGKDSANEICLIFVISSLSRQKTLKSIGGIFIDC
jgi:hypothetical protein